VRSAGPWYRPSVAHSSGSGRAAGVELAWMMSSLAGGGVGVLRRCYYCVESDRSEE